MTKVDAILEKAGGGSAQTIVEALGVYADKDFSGYTIEEAIRELPEGGGGGGGKVDYYLNTSNNDNPTLDIPATLKKIDPVSGVETIVVMQESTMFDAPCWHAVLDSDAWYYVFVDWRQWKNIDSEISYLNALDIDDTPFQTISTLMFPVPSEPRYIYHLTNWNQQVG